MNKDSKAVENQKVSEARDEAVKYDLDLISANKELAYQNQEKENRAAELMIANKELAYQNQEKENRAAELMIANEELAYQNQEKENRAAELMIANKELAYQNKEKENRAAELMIANKELAYQNQEKENRAAELMIANEELAYQNQEKENRAAELMIANKELAYQNQEKENRAAELMQANKDLETFAFISSHDLQEPLRKIQTFANRVLDEEMKNLTDKGRFYFERIQNSAFRMQTLLNDLLAHQRSTEKGADLEKINFRDSLNAVLDSQEEDLKELNVSISVPETCLLTVIPFQFRQLLQNLISNAIKFRKVDQQLEIVVTCKISTKNDVDFRNLATDIIYSHITIADNGMGFDEKYKELIFEIFRRLNDNNLYSGTGIGLTIVQKIVENHQGFIFASSEEGKGATFDIYLPFLSENAAGKIEFLH